MPYEIVFNQKPNIGTSKKIVEIGVNDKNEEIEIEVSKEDITQPTPLPIATTSQHTSSLIATSTQPTPLPIATQPTSSLIATTTEDTQPPAKNTKNLRSQVKLNQDKAVEKMENKHNHKRNKKTVTYSVSDSVSVLIPRIDRGGSDLPRIPGVICRISGEFYEICTKFGKLNDCLRADELEKYHGTLDFDYKTVTNKVSMREAV